MKTVLVVAYHFPPASTSGTHRTFKFVKYLTQFGFRPVVLTIHTPRDRYRDEALLRELPSDVRIIRTRSLELTGVRRFLMRLKLFRPVWFVFYPLFWEGAALWFYPALWKGLRLIRDEKVDLIFTTSGPFTSLGIGWWLKKFTGKPWIADMRDPLYLHTGFNWPSRWHYCLTRKMEQVYLKGADRVVTVCPTMVADYVQNLGLLPHRLECIPNGYDETDFRHLWTPSGTKERDVLTLKYIGTLRGATKQEIQNEFAKAEPKRGWESLKQAIQNRFEYRVTVLNTLSRSAWFILQGLKKALDGFPQLKGKIKLVLVGETDGKVRTQIRELGLENTVEVKSLLSHAASIDEMVNADLLLLPVEYRWDRKKAAITSGKVFEYLATGKPILILARDCDGRDIATQAGVAKRCDPVHIDEIARRLHDLFVEHQNGGIQVQPDWEYIQQFERRRLTQKLACVFESCLDKRTREIHESRILCTSNSGN